MRADRLRHLLAPAAPAGRVALLRTAISLFVICDVLWIVDDVVPLSQGDGSLYRPLLVRRLLGLPAPSEGYALALRAVVVAAALVAASGRMPRVAGVVLAAGFTEWVAVGYSFSKIDHDHFALVAALWVLPTAGAARFGDLRRSEAAGWVVRSVQLSVVAAYLLSAVAKLRFGGVDWANGATFTWAMVRRGTPLGRRLLEPPWLLQAGQWSVLVLELLSPLLLLALRGRWRHAAVATFAAFHVATWFTLKIHFLPLVVCLLAFLPLERVRPRRRSAPPAVEPEPALSA